jgi:predicted nucleic acid-binding protein
VIVVDSSVWIDFFKGAATPERASLRALLRDNPSQLIVPDLVMFEVLRGFRGERDMRLAKTAFLALQMAAVVDAQAAERAAERYRRLREAGVTIRSGIDVLIASYCIDHDLILLQRDRDFLPFERHFGLRLLQPMH